MTDEVKRGRGRPKLDPSQNIRQPEVADAIIAWISAGQTLRQFCREHPISKTEVYAWLNSDDNFAVRFARARRIGHDEIAEQCMEIADNPLLGVETVEKPTGKEIREGDMLGHRKLQIETRLKLLAKWDPRYSEKSSVQLSGDPEGSPIKTESTVTMTAEEAYKRMLGG